MRKWMGKWIGISFTAGIIAAAFMWSGQPSVLSANTAANVQIDEQIEHWIVQLAEANDWESWKSPATSWQKQPLGPGQHGWVVLLEHNGETIGYLVVYADPYAPEDKLVLGEYGEGPSALFSIHTLYQTMVQHGLIPDGYDLDALKERSDGQRRSYLGPLQAVWEIDWNGRTYYFDAVTGEQLPLQSDWFQTAQKLDLEKNKCSHTEMKTASLSEMKKLEAFDPYEQWIWLVEQPLHVDRFSDLQPWLREDNQVSYVSLLYHKQITVPFAVSGYQQWTSCNETFIRVDHFGAQRFIPFAALQQFGEFYANF